LLIKTGRIIFDKIVLQLFYGGNLKGVRLVANKLFAIMSAFLFFAAIYMYRQTNPSKKNRILFSTGIFFFIILYAAYFIADYFTGKGVTDSVIYHLKYGLRGGGFLEYWEITAVSTVCIISGLLFSLWIASTRAKCHDKGIAHVWASYLLILASFLSNPTLSYSYSLLYFKPDTADFSTLYIQPVIRQIDEPANVVVIYAESFERTYFNESIFPGLIKGLRRLEAESTYFTNITQVDFTGWTIAGFVSSQCGIPLIAPSHGNSMSGMDQYLPSAVSLGDLLHDQGYYLAYFGGADLDFAGKGKFFRTHKFDEIYGRDELLAYLEDPSYKTGWGLYDDTLFDIAYRRFVELSQTQDRFGLFMLTLDTHHPNGHLSKSCEQIIYQDGSNPILNAVAGSDYLITKFVNKIRHSPYGPKTVVVVLSDHLALKNTAYDLLNKAKRTNLFMILKPDEKQARDINLRGSTLDVGSTILPFIGYKGSIGLGRDLTDAGYVRSEVETIHNNLVAWKEPISGFWNFPKIEKSLEINLRQKTICIDGRDFKFPVLIELNDWLETNLKFQFDNSVMHKTLVEHVLGMDDDMHFILIDECKKARALDETLGQTGFCLIAGKGRQYYKSMPITEDIILTCRDVRRLTGLTPSFQMARVAHAGGGVNRMSHTNSHDALDHNLKQGFSHFELDFSFTEDGKLVCIHDYEENFEAIFGFQTEEKPTLDAFKSLVEKASGFKNCTLESLTVWMEQNPSVFIITDIKEDNLIRKSPGL